MHVENIVRVTMHHHPPAVSSVHHDFTQLTIHEVFLYACASGPFRAKLQGLLNQNLMH
jgi:hypothetical protein